MIDATPIRHGLRRIAASYDRHAAIDEARALPRRRARTSRRPRPSKRSPPTEPGNEGPGRRRVLPACRRPGAAESGHTGKRSPPAMRAPRSGCSSYTARCRRCAALRARDPDAIIRAASSARNGGARRAPGRLRPLPVSPSAVELRLLGGMGSTAAWPGASSSPCRSSGSTWFMPTTRSRPATRCDERPQELPLVVSVHGGDVYGRRRRQPAVQKHARLCPTRPGQQRRDRATLPRARRPADASGPPRRRDPARGPRQPLGIPDARHCRPPRGAQTPRRCDQRAGLAEGPLPGPALRDRWSTAPNASDSLPWTLSLGLQRQVEFRGQLSPAEAVAAAQTASLFVMPSVEEAFGVAYVEAMAGGVPAIGCQDEDGPAEIAAAGDGIVLVPATRSTSPRPANRLPARGSGWARAAGTSRPSHGRDRLHLVALRGGDRAGLPQCPGAPIKIRC